MSQNNVHTETSHQTDNTLRNGEWFAIRRRVSPCHSKFFAFQVLNTAELMDDVEHISHTLCRMVNITLQVYKSRSLLKDTIFVSFCNSVHELFLISMTFTDVHIITDTDYISHKGYHVSCLTNSLTMSDLRFLLIQILNLKTKQVAGRSERETSTGRVITENRNTKTTLKYLSRDVVLSHKTKSISYSKYSLKFLISLIPCPEKVIIVHFLKV